MAKASASTRAIWSVVREHPRLWIDHLHAYADLLQAESAAWAAHWAVKGLWCLGALLLAAVGLTLAGVASMLAMLAPELAARLWLVPAVTLVAACGCAWAARRGPPAPSMLQVRAQWDADRDLFSAPP